jgi:hypothetical protein
MHGISESEKQQLRESVIGRTNANPNSSSLAPGAPVVSMSTYLRQVEEWARLFPQAQRSPALGTHWKL